MSTLLLYLIVGLGAVGAILAAAFVGALHSIVSDEVRARIDDIPAVLVELALRLAPEAQRDFLRVDWVDNLLVAFDEKNARYPAARLVRSLPFVLPLFGTAFGRQRQARAIPRQAEQDEKLERLPEPQVIRLAGIPSAEAFGQPDVTVVGPDGSLLSAIEFK
ncbi:MAG: hypothetical protein QOD10_3522 [Mycobacterium sp.]|nr:hypothetical protein [Mycobacterium sp.]